MTLLNILIIYLACGSPFGVYQLTRADGERSPSEWRMAAAAFLLWPVFLIKFLFERSAPHIVSRKDRIEQIRVRLERLAFSGVDTASLFEFREAFYRYAGLADSALGVETTQDPVGELLAISGRKLDPASSKCLWRRNREKIEFHLTQARNEFVEMIVHLSKDERTGDDIIALGIELTKILGDTPATEDLTALSNNPATAIIADRTLSEEVWKGHVKSASNIS